MQNPSVSHAQPSTLDSIVYLLVISPNEHWYITLHYVPAVFYTTISSLVFLSNSYMPYVMLCKTYDSWVHRQTLIEH
jgi:hypothetical protein